MMKMETIMTLKVKTWGPKAKDNSFQESMLVQEELESDEDFLDRVIATLKATRTSIRTNIEGT